jgi:peptidoglycan/LPS O-acetylase OafA/YrhL
MTRWLRRYSVGLRAALGLLLTVGAITALAEGHRSGQHGEIVTEACALVAGVGFMVTALLQYLRTPQDGFRTSEGGTIGFLVAILAIAGGFALGKILS